jgi:hypothetical protein
VRPATEIHRPSGEQSGTPELGGHEGHLAVGPDVVEDEDVRMIQRGDVTGFMLEPIAARPVCRQLGRKHLQRDFTAQPRVARAIDLAMPPAPSGLTISYCPMRVPGVTGRPAPESMTRSRPCFRLSAGESARRRKRPPDFILDGRGGDRA